MYSNPEEVREYELQKELQKTKREMRRQKRDIDDLQFEHGRLHSAVMWIVSAAVLAFLVWLYMSTMVS